MAEIRKVKLSDGSIYSFFDEGAFRLNENNILITGNNLVDEVILQGSLYITEIDDVPIEHSIENVLVQNTSNGLIQKRSVNKLLEDIGGISCKVDGTTAVFKVGRFE